MTARQSSPPPGQAPKPRRSRTVPPVIDLEAVDITAQAAPSAPIEPNPSEDPEPVTMAETGGTTQKPAPEQAEDLRKQELFFKPSRDVILAGVMGGAIGALLLAIAYIGWIGLDPTAGQMAALDSVLHEKAPLQALTALDQRLAANEAAIRPLQAALASKTDTGAITTRLSALESAVNTITANTSDKGLAASHAAAALILAVLINDKIATGEPYRQEIDALSGFSSLNLPLTTLKLQAATGVKTFSALRAEFGPLALPPKAPAPAETEPQTLGSKLLNAVSSLVKITPAQEAAASVPKDIAAIIDTALANHDITAALNAWQILPEQTRMRTQPWADTLIARRATDEAGKVLVTAALEALTAKGAAP